MEYSEKAWNMLSVKHCLPLVFSSHSIYLESENRGLQFSFHRVLSRKDARQGWKHGFAVFGQGCVSAGRGGGGGQMVKDRNAPTKHQGLEKALTCVERQQGTALTGSPFACPIHKQSSATCVGWKLSALNQRGLQLMYEIDVDFINNRLYCDKGTAGH